MGILVLLVTDDVQCMISASKVESGRENKDDEKYKRLSTLFKRTKKPLESESSGTFK